MATESVPVTVNPADEIRPGSMGVPMDGIELRIVDIGIPARAERDALQFSCDGLLMMDSTKSVV